jgi:hypothetical protein
MAKKDVTVSVDFVCLKELECANCATTFRYPHKSSVSGTGPTNAQARSDAVRKSTAELEGEPGSERCPNCGALAECMEVDTRALLSGCRLWYTVFVVAVAVFVGYLLNEHIVAFVSLSSLIWITVALLLPAVALDIWLARWNANADLQFWAEQGKKKLERIPIAVVSTGTEIKNRNSIPRATSLTQQSAIVVAIMGLCVMPAAEIMGLISGWHSNPSAFPPVAGPGDQVILYWPESLECLKRKWKGIVEVQFTDEQQTLAPTPLKAICPSEDWGRFVGGKGTRNTDITIWTQVTLPEDPSLSGKTIRMPSKISVVYPHSTGIFGFENREAEFATEFQFRLSSPQAAQKYLMIWWVGLLIGGGMVVVSGFVLRRYELNVLKTSMYPITLNVTKLEDITRAAGSDAE